MITKENILDKLRETDSRLKNYIGMTPLLGIRRILPGENNGRNPAHMKTYYEKNDRYYHITITSAPFNDSLEIPLREGIVIDIVGTL